MIFPVVFMAYKYYYFRVIIPDKEEGRMKRSIIVLIAGMFLFAGCGGITPIQKVKAPDWVIKGSGAFEKERGKAFYGIGSASGIKSFSLLRSAADNRARNEIAKIFETYSSSLMKDYMASTTAGEKDVSSEEQHVEQVIKTVTKSTLTGVEIINHWQNPDTGELYSLARLDLVTFKENLEKAKELDSKVRDYIRDNASRLHEELEKEEEKR
jgi:hypothetical protein